MGAAFEVGVQHKGRRGSRSLHDVFGFGKQAGRIRRPYAALVQRGRRRFGTGRNNGNCLAFNVISGIQHLVDVVVPVRFCFLFGVRVSIGYRAKRNSHHRRNQNRNEFIGKCAPLEKARTAS